MKSLGVFSQHLLPGVVITLATLLSGCNDSSKTVTTFDPQRLPQDARLAEIYQRSCKSCHGDPANGAPLSGDSQIWAERVDKGMDQLLLNTIEGYKSMPALGLCMDCSEDDLRGLIQFMAQP